MTLPVPQEGWEAPGSSSSSPGRVLSHLPLHPPAPEGWGQGCSPAWHVAVLLPAGVVEGTELEAGRAVAARASSDLGGLQVPGSPRLEEERGNSKFYLSDDSQSAESPLPEARCLDSYSCWHFLRRPSWGTRLPRERWPHWGQAVQVLWYPRAGDAPTSAHTRLHWHCWVEPHACSCVIPCGSHHIPGPDLRQRDMCQDRDTVMSPSLRISLSMPRVSHVASSRAQKLLACWELGFDNREWCCPCLCLGGIGLCF